MMVSPFCDRICYKNKWTIGVNSTQAITIRYAKNVIIFKLLSHVNDSFKCHWRHYLLNCPLFLKITMQNSNKAKTIQADHKDNIWPTMVCPFKLSWFERNKLKVIYKIFTPLFLNHISVYVIFKFQSGNRSSTLILQRVFIFFKNEVNSNYM